jgi:hypothetical protein
MNNYTPSLVTLQINRIQWAKNMMAVKNLIDAYQQSGNLFILKIMQWVSQDRQNPTHWA